MASIVTITLSPALCETHRSEDAVPEARYASKHGVLREVVGKAWALTEQAATFIQCINYAIQGSAHCHGDFVRIYHCPNLLRQRRLQGTEVIPNARANLPTICVGLTCSFPKNLHRFNCLLYALIIGEGTGSAETLASYGPGRHLPTDCLD